MSIEEFKNARFGAGNTVTYNGKTRQIVSVNFEENLIGLLNPLDDDSLDWVRCENTSDFK